MKWLIDEMLRPATATELRELGHDATSVREIGLGGRPDAEVLARAVDEGRVLVTENFADYAILIEDRLARDEPCVPVAFVRKTDLRRRGGLSADLAGRLHRWAQRNPDPYVGPHWP